MGRVAHRNSVMPATIGDSLTANYCSEESYPQMLRSLSELGRKRQNVFNWRVEEKRPIGHEESTHGTDIASFGTCPWLAETTEQDWKTHTKTVIFATFAGIGREASD